MGTALGQLKEHGGQGLVSAYIEHIGGREPRRRDLPRLGGPHPLHASVLVAQSCTLIISGYDHAADKMLRDVRDTMHHIAEPETENFDETASHNRHLFHLAIMLLERDDQLNAAQTFQAAAHKKAVQELSAENTALKGENNSIRAEMDELRSMIESIIVSQKSPKE